MQSIYVNPQEVDDPDAVASHLARILQRPFPEVREKLVGKGAFVWLERQVAPEIVSQLQELNLRGVYFKNETRRYYPKQHLAGQVLGFVGVDEQGLGGVELQIFVSWPPTAPDYVIA
jgi:cell division protein FtsI (penicillin-binding protein 3)